MTRVLVLGASGMLGSMLTHVFRADPRLDTVTTTRRAEEGNLPFVVESDSLDELLAATRCEWVVNAVGCLAWRINEDDPASVSQAVSVNALFPNRLAAATAGRQRVIHFSTDGVFAGREAPYDETAQSDADDIYGRSKRLGEARAPHVLNVRCSIVGPEQPPGRSLLGWALSQPRGSEITGYTNHLWNGLTTLHLAKLCAAVILGENPGLPGILHLVPDDAVTKADLLARSLAAFGREDVTVRSERAVAAVDRRLATVHRGLNERLWEAAGYARAPKIADMIDELASTRDVRPVLPGGGDSLQSRTDAARHAHSRDTAGSDPSESDTAAPF